MNELDVRTNRAQRATRDNGAAARCAFRTDIAVEMEGEKADVATQADRGAQYRVVEQICGVLPDEPIVGEEENERRPVPESGPAWIVDPIDGTNSFARNVPVQTTTVAAVRDGDPVAAANYLPTLDDCYVADDETASWDGEEISVSRRDDPETCTVCPTFWQDYDARDEYAAVARVIVIRFGDLRCYGNMQVVPSYVADGSFDGVITNKRINLWDSATGVHLVRMVGGTVTNLDGNAWRHDSEDLVALNGHVHDVAPEATRKIDGRQHRREAGGRLR